LYETPICQQSFDATNDQELDCEFCIDELEEAIRKLSVRKAPGSDGIPNEVWKSLSSEQKCYLLESFNSCWNNCNFLLEWSEIIISPMFKKGDRSNPENYRPMSLLNTGMKLFTSMLSNRLNTWCDKKSMISDYQAAYRKTFGSEDHVFVLNTAIQYNISRRRKLYALFIDLSKAFDSVRHDKLWAKLHVAGLSSKFIRTVQTLYHNAKAKIRTNQGESYSFPIKNSVLQGETLSPKLFSLFVEDIVNILYKSGLTSVKILKAEIDILLYADDMILLAYNVFDLQEKINILSNFFHENDLHVNLSKTKVVIFRQGNTKLRKPKIFWGESEIEIVDKYVYLGVPMYGNMKYTQTADDFVNKGLQAQRELFNLFYKSK
jgi:hypothetical protein